MTIKHTPAIDASNFIQSPRKKPVKVFGMWTGGVVSPTSNYGLFGGNTESTNHTAHYTQDSEAGPFNYFETGTVDETSAGLKSTTLHLSPLDLNSYWFFKWRAGSATVANCHYNIGIWDRTTYPADSPLDNQHGVLCSYRSGSNSDRLRVLHNNGGVTQTTINLGADFLVTTSPLDRVYTFELQFDGDVNNQFDYRVTVLNVSTIVSADTGWIHVSSLGPSWDTDLGWTMSCITKVAANNIEIDNFMAYMEGHALPPRLH